MKNSIMDSFIWIGTTLGAALGLLHGTYVYRTISARTPGISPRGLYAAVWTVALWTLFGSYVLAFWLIGCIAGAVVHLLPRRNVAG